MLPAKRSLNGMCHEVLGMPFQGTRHDPGSDAIMTMRLFQMSKEYTWFVENVLKDRDYMEYRIVGGKNKTKYVSTNRPDLSDKKLRTSVVDAWLRQFDLDSFRSDNCSGYGAGPVKACMPYKTGGSNSLSFSGKRLTRILADGF